MKKILYIAASCVCAAVLVSCNCGAGQTPSQAASEYSQHIINGDYGTLADVVVVMDDVTVTPHPDTLKAANHPSIASKGGIRDILVVSEDVSVDGKSAEVALVANYNDGTSENINYSMVNDGAKWKIQAHEGKYIWKTWRDVPGEGSAPTEPQFVDVSGEGSVPATEGTTAPAAAEGSAASDASTPTDGSSAAPATDTAPAAEAN